MSSLIVAAFVLGGCASDLAGPTPARSMVPTMLPPASATPVSTPTPSTDVTPGVSLLPLPDELGRIPHADEPSAELFPQTPPGELTLGEARDFTLGHCGLLSPVDIDGSLWDAVGAHSGSGGALTQDQVGDLINGTPSVVTLIDADTMELRTAHGAVVTLIRHDGPRRYFLCD